MTLLGDMEAAVNPRDKPCRAALVLNALSPEERALADRLPAHRIAPILARNGHPIATSTVHRHRRGECSCSQTT